MKIKGDQRRSLPKQPRPNLERRRTLIQKTKEAERVNGPTSHSRPPTVSNKTVVCCSTASHRGIDQASAALKAFLNGKVSTFPESVKTRYMRDPSFFPEGATTSRAVGAALLETQSIKVGATDTVHHMTKCAYHLDLDKQGKAGKDRVKQPNDPTSGIVGIPAIRIGKKEVQRGAMPALGYLHCGCRLDDALLDMIWIKTSTVDSPELGTGVIEGWKDMKPLYPRMRRTLQQRVIAATGLIVDDLFKYDDRKFESLPERGAGEKLYDPRASPANEPKTLLEKQKRHIQARLDAL